jgi:hypothetical protein
LERIDPHRFGDVLQLRRTKVADGKIEPRFDLPIGLLRETDRAGFGDTFQSRGDINAIPHEVAVTLLDHIAQMNTDASAQAKGQRCARPCRSGPR